MSPAASVEPAVGTAGWALPAAHREHFVDGASNLARYATRLNCVEINSSFYRRHRPATWQRWADSVPDDFRFSVKVPKLITHVNRLDDCDALIDAFASEVCELGSKLSIALVQLAPKHGFDATVAERFFAQFGSRVAAQLVCEPRHPSWFDDAANKVLRDAGVARVAADPAVVPAAARPGGAPGVRYWRLHGSPLIYRSSYDRDALEGYAAAIRADMGTSETWCIFDNTASSAATGNALDLRAAIRRA